MLGPRSHRTHALADLHANLGAKPLMLFVSCVNTVIGNNYKNNYYVRVPVARCFVCERGPRMRKSLKCAEGRRWGYYT